MLIGLTGKAGSGKDSAYGFIADWAEAAGRPVRRDAFADRLKISAARALGYKGDDKGAIVFCNDLKQPDTYVGFFTHDLDYPATPVGHPMAFLSGREYLQFYGTEAHRDVFGEDFWIDAVMARYNPVELLVITDVRFDNEAQAVHDAGGMVWEIRRSALDGTDAHPSEQPIDISLVDGVILNEGSLADLEQCVLNLLTLVKV